MELLNYNLSSIALIRLLKLFLEKGLDLDIKNYDNKNFYQMLKDKKGNVRGNIEIKLEELNEIEKYIDEHFPKYKKELEFQENVQKYNL